MSARLPRPALTDDERETIRVLYRRTRSPLSVAEATGRSRATVHRVLAGFEAVRRGDIGASKRLRADGSVATRKPRGGRRA